MIIDSIILRKKSHSICGKQHYFLLSGKCACTMYVNEVDVEKNNVNKLQQTCHNFSQPADHIAR